MNYLRLTFFLLLVFSALSCSGDKVTLVDTIPPAAITDFRVQSTEQVFSLSWTAPGGDGTLGLASRYDIRYAATNLQGSWNSAAAIPSPPVPGLAGGTDSLVVQGIGPGPWEFGIRTGDSGGNWSRLSNIVTSSLLADTIPPAAISDLSVRSTGLGIYLRWTAPGDDGEAGRSSQYDIRYASGDLTAEWETATVVSSPPIPGVSGQTDSVSVLGIGWGPWEFGIRTSDGWNWSEISNIVTSTIPEDTTPPAAVTDLALEQLIEGGVVLGWTAVGDDNGIGQASEYDLRYAEVPISPDGWAGATRVQGMGTPRPSGERELFAVTGLQQGPTYHFALRVLDEFENSSDLSNPVSASPSLPVQITFNTDTGGAFLPDWSPDGQRIAFSASYRVTPTERRPDLYVIPAAGGSAVRYSSASEGAQWASWSPDGGRFAFSQSVDEQTRTVLALMDARPGAAPQVLVDPGVAWIWTISARWSPDGSRIAYYIATFTPPSVAKMYTVASTGGVPELLAGDGTWGINGLDWSPDGTQIIYASKQTGTYHLWLIPSGGGTATQLTSGLGSETYPAWSPDGTKVAYVASGQVWMIDASGENATQITFDSERNPRTLTWSPDGNTIAYGAITNQISNIWILRVR